MPSYLFNKLRSEQSIGYQVSSKSQLIENVLINQIFIQGKNYTPFKMVDMLNISLKEFKHFLANMTNEEFELKRDISYVSINDGIDSLDKFEMMVYYEIKNKTYDYKRRHKVKDEVNNINKEEFVKF